MKVAQPQKANSYPQDTLISVIVPTYREERHIAACLKSVKNQKLNKDTSIEIIVVDSHSPDRTMAIAKRFADKVIDLKSRGVGRARNAGAKIAKGEILIFVDADTSLDPDFVSEMQRTFNDCRVVYATGKIKVLEKLNPADSLFATIHYLLLNMTSMVTSHSISPFFPTVCCGCRRKVFNESGGFEEDIAVAEDVSFSMKMGKTGKCAFSDKALAYTSARRILKCGKIRMYSMYFKNYFNLFVLKQKPWIKEFPHIE